MEHCVDFSSIVTASSAMKEVVKMAEKVALVDVNILLTGESGTGKTILSRAIHDASSRREGPFVTVNCMAMPETLVESELFGHEKGAFTDAHMQKRGSFEMAHQGTLFLDEIGDMVPPAQGKILQAIEEKQFKRLGSEKPIESDTRIISATNCDLRKKIEQGDFREDLYYRLREVCIYVPPLRERREDIPLLICHYVKTYCQQFEKPELKVSDAALSYLTAYDWPGNIRELKNVVKSAVVMCPQDVIWLEHFPFEIRSKNTSAVLEDPDPDPDDFSIDCVLKHHMVAVLDYCHWNKTKAAKALGVSRPRLDRYISKYQLRPSGASPKPLNQK